MEKVGRMGPGAGGAAPCIPFGVGLGFGVCGAGVYIVLLAGKYKNRRRAWGRIFYTPNGIAGIRHAADFIFRGYFYSGPDSPLPRQCAAAGLAGVLFRAGVCAEPHLPPGRRLALAQSLVCIGHFAGHTIGTYGKSWRRTRHSLGMNIVYQVTNNVMQTEAGSHSFPRWRSC